MAQPLPQSPLPAASDAPARARRPRGRVRRWLRRIFLTLAVLVGVLLVAGLAGGLWLRSEIRSSLPQLDGERAIPGLGAPVSVERDGLGVPTLRAANRRDAARALGFLHAQDRFFQMDLMRRQAAGELSEIFGPLALEVDRPHRVHRFRHVARQTLARATPEERAVLEAYAAGVNAGLAGLAAKPFEYVPLRLAPAPWKAEDSILVVLAMFLELQGDAPQPESDRGMMADLLPRELFDFLTPAGTGWDAPIEGDPIPMPPLPGPEVIDLRAAPAETAKAAALSPRKLDETAGADFPGSNNWAVAGAHTADGRALLANDMHLGISVPNTWYRASIIRPDGSGGQLRITGVTLPGAPSIVVGSNGHVAWGFTNSYGDWTDLVILESDPSAPNDPEVYRTPQGPRRLEHHQERIKVKGGEDEVLDVATTIWGPVVDKDHRGRRRVLAWTAHHPEAVNLRLSGVEEARTLEQAMAVANVSGAPAQNFVVADETGRIGWTIMGVMQRRVGFDGEIPTSWADGTRGWNGWLAPEEVPRVVDPPAGRIWTANARVVSGDKLARLGDSGYDLGARAGQIRDGLLALDKATPQDMLKIQLDDRALFLTRWRELLLRTLNEQAIAGKPRLQELRRLVEQTWTGRASVDSMAYRAVRSFRTFTNLRTFTSLTAACQKADSRFVARVNQAEGPLWALVSQRPMHLLDSQYESWDALLLAAVDDSLAAWKETSGTEDLAPRTWGERNTTRIEHPLAGAVPLAGRWLNVPPRPVPGDHDMPRVQGPGFGASERLVVSPGQEEKGFFHMPVGQSGHPMSPYYQAGHEAWEEGRPTPFLPGKAEHTLRLVPAG